MTVKTKYAFRPLARLPITIGADLIQNPISAIVELIKNAYDADASRVDIRFFNQEGKDVVTISDDGHGMSRETVLDVFMGSGTTLLSCQRLGLSGTGIEINEKYFDIACQRLQEAISKRGF